MRLVVSCEYPIGIYVPEIMRAIKSQTDAHVVQSINSVFLNLVTVSV